MSESSGSSRASMSEPPNSSGSSSSERPLSVGLRFTPLSAASSEISLESSSNIRLLSSSKSELKSESESKAISSLSSWSPISSSSPNKSSSARIRSSSPETILPVSEGLWPVSTSLPESTWLSLCGKLISLPEPRSMAPLMSSRGMSALESAIKSISLERSSASSNEERLIPASSANRLISSILNFQLDPDRMPNISFFDRSSVNSSADLPSNAAASSRGIKFPAIIYAAPKIILRSLSFDV